MKSLEEIPGIGPQTAGNLAEHGFPDAGAVAGTTVDALATVPGFSAARAEKTIKAAKALMRASGKAATKKKPVQLSLQQEEAPKTDENDEKKKKKKKKDKKEKKKKKDKKKKKK
jgi:hypothetical protein